MAICLRAEVPTWLVPPTKAGVKLGSKHCQNSMASYCSSIYGHQSNKSDQTISLNTHHRASVSLPDGNRSPTSIWSSSHSSLEDSDDAVDEQANAYTFLRSKSAKQASRFRVTMRYLKGERVSFNSFASAIINFTNSILGAGLMGIPYAMSKAGLIPGCFLLILIALISGTILILMNSTELLRLVCIYYDKER